MVVDMTTSQTRNIMLLGVDPNCRRKKKHLAKYVVNQALLISNTNTILREIMVVINTHVYGLSPGLLEI